MVEYKIAAIPTLYKGIQYRSRLEARWAAFFDLLGWRHTYEPYDLGLWSPDFLIKHDAELSYPLLVEVKPISELCDETVLRMTSACREAGFFPQDPTSGLPDGSPIVGALLVGVCPIPVSPKAGVVTNHHLWDVNIGWLINDGGHVSSVSIYWTSDFDQPIMTADIGRVDRNYRGCWTAMGGDGMEFDDLNNPPMKSYAEYTMGLWKRACNTVQWIGRNSP